MVAEPLPLTVRMRCEFLPLLSLNVSPIVIMDEDALGHNILLATDSYKVRIDSIRFKLRRITVSYLWDG